MPRSNPYYNSPYNATNWPLDPEKRIKEDPVGSLLGAVDPAAAERWRRQQAAALSGRPYA